MTAAQQSAVRSPVPIIIPPGGVSFAESIHDQSFQMTARKDPFYKIIYVIRGDVVLEREGCPRIIGTKDTSRDMPRFQQVLHEIKPQRPDFACLIGWEELLCASLFMGGDGGTLSSAGVVPEVIMKIYSEARADHWAEAKRVQFKLLDLFSLMVNAPNFPEGFRAGYELRGFTPGRARFPLSPGEMELMADIRQRIACVLSECGFSEAAKVCENRKAVPDSDLRATVEAIVRNVVASRP